MAGEEVIKAMKPVYEIYSNNCQKFTIELLNKICEDGRQKVITDYSYITQTKMGIHIPFLSHDSEVKHQEAIDLPSKEEAVAKAISVMDEHTPRVAQRDIGTIGVHHESEAIVMVHRAST